MEKIIYALKDGCLVSIEDVESGIACGCKCPACNENLVAKKGKIKIHHFAHSSTTNCEHAFESSLHLLAKEIFKNSKYFVIPKVTFGNYEPICLEEEKPIKIKSVDVEKYINDIKPDIILEDENENKYCIEIFVTHKVDSEKLTKIKELKLNTLEFDLSKIKKLVTYEELENMLLNDVSIMKWLYHEKIENAENKYGIPISKLNFCDKQCKSCPDFTFCLTHCYNNIGESKEKQLIYCKNADEIKKKFDLRCPLCKGKLIRRYGYSLKYKRNHYFYGCSNFPTCKFTRDC